MAVTRQFKLFSQEAVRIMRSEIFKPEVWNNYRFNSNLAQVQLRGYAKEHAPFTYAAWTHPSTVAIVSELAGINLARASTMRSLISICLLRRLSGRLRLSPRLCVRRSNLISPNKEFCFRLSHGCVSVCVYPYAVGFHE